MKAIADANFLRFIGTTWKNCGDSQAQENAESADSNFAQMMTNNYQTVFGQNQNLLNNLTSNFNSIISGGPSQTGWSPQEAAATNSQVVNSAAANNKYLQQQIGDNAAAHSGGGPGLENGNVSTEKALASASVLNNEANAQLNNTVQNYNTGRQNYWSAISGEATAPGALENPATSIGNVINTGNENTASQANQNAASDNAWIGLVGGLAGDAASSFGAYEGAKK